MKAADTFLSELKLGESLASLSRDVRNASLEAAACICEDMVVVGRAWTEEQAIAARVLNEAAKRIRGIKVSP